MSLPMDKTRKKQFNRFNTASIKFLAIEEEFP